MWHKPQVMNWVSNLLIGLAVLAFLYAGLFVVVHLPNFRVKTVSIVRPLQHVTREQVDYVLKNEMRGNFFTVDLEGLREDFRKLPWVKDVSLRRRWPDVLEIDMTEHQAVARWGESRLLNPDGESFSAATPEDLPVFHGENGMEREMLEGYRKLDALLKPIARRPVELWLTNRRAWTLKLDDGLVIQLGRERVEDRLQRFIEVFARTRSTLPTLDYVDLRYPNGFAVRMTPAMAPAGMKVAPAKKPAAPNKNKAKAGGKPAPAAVKTEHKAA